MLGSLIDILQLLLTVALGFVLIHVIMSWLISFQVLNLHQRFVAQVWYGLGRLLEPIYSRVRRFLPNTGGLDLAPLVVFILIFVLRDIVLRDIGRAF